MTRRSMTRTIGHRVIAVDTADELGAVRSFVVGRSGRSIDRVQISGRKKNAMFADWAELESFGDDAVMVRNAVTPSTSDDERDQDVARGDVDILGAKVLDTDGFEHGTVTDVDFDGSSGAIVSVATSTGATLDADAIRSLGTYALVVEST